MATTADSVTVELRADIDAYESGMNRAAQTSGTALSVIETKVSKTERAILTLGPAAATAATELTALGAAGGVSATELSTLVGLLSGGLAGAASVVIPLVISLGKELIESASASDKAADGYDHAKAAADRYASALRALREAGAGNNATQLLTEISKREIEISRLQAQTGGNRGGAIQRAIQVKDLQEQNQRDRDLLAAEDARNAAVRRNEEREDAAREARQARQRQARKAETDAQRREREEQAAAQREAKRFADSVGGIAHGLDQANDYVGKGFSEQFGKNAEAGIRQIEKEAEVRNSLAVEAGEERRRIEERNIRSLADIYETAFTRGTKGIVDLFKQEMIRAIAVSLAKLTISKLPGIATSLGSFFQAGTVPGRASGGYIPPRGLARVNEHAGGVELLRLGSSGGTVIPLGAGRAASGGGQTVAVYQSFTLDARGGITTPELLAHVETVRRDAVNVAAQAGKAAFRGAPAAISQQQTLGTVS